MADYIDLVKSVFSNQAGDKLRAEWNTMYQRRISYQPDLTPEEVAFREGERNIIQQIEDILDE